MSARVSRLSNEVIVFIPDVDWTPQLIRSLTNSGTPQIIVDDVIHFVTPFGSHMLCLQMTVTRANASTHDLKEYLVRLLIRNGLSMDMSHVHAPARPRLFRAA